jgi:hypothetical protein
MTFKVLADAVDEKLAAIALLWLKWNRAAGRSICLNSRDT